MKVTKHEHACLEIEAQGDILIVDPGMFTTLLDPTTHVVAVVITHEHPDHWTPEHLGRILKMSPDARIFGPSGVAVAAADFDITVVAAGDEHTVGAFTVRFFGEKHAEIHRSIPLVDNVGVLVNDELYYAGDSYTVPEGVQVGTLAAPAGAPWLKIGEVMDYVEAIAPKRSFPTHEMVLSVAGKNMSNQRIGQVTEAGGGTFHPLQPGESLDI